MTTRLLLTAITLLVVAAAGCLTPEGDTTPIRGQRTAVEFLWSYYGQTKSPPTIYWRKDYCNEPNGIYGVWRQCSFVFDGVRVAGIEIDTDEWIELGAPSDGFTISDTVIAHELLHAAIGDMGHTSKQWDDIVKITNTMKIRGL